MDSPETFALIPKLYQSSPEIIRDFFLAENQLPFFVVEGLCEMAFDKQCSEYSDYDIVSAIAIFNEGDKNVFRMDRSTIKQKLGASNIKHLLDLLRTACAPSRRRAQPHIETSLPLKIPSAVQLDAAGVKFEAGVGGNLLEIQFTNGVLVIPKIPLYDSSESYFRSILAFEFKYYPFDRYFTDYLLFFEDLIDTQEDVDILVRSGIIENWIGSNEAVANLLTSVTANVLMSPFKVFYSDLYAGLNEYANIKWNKWKAILKRDYFNHPWAFISFMYAIVLFVLTLVQTIKS